MGHAAAAGEQSLGDASVALARFREAFAGGSGEPPAEGAIIHFTLRTADVDAIVERVRAAGAKVTMEPRSLDIPSDPPAAVRIAFFTGPDGEVIEVFHELAK